MNIALLTLPLSCVGIYLTYFYFGSASYFYYNYDFLNIFTTSLNLAILVGLINYVFFVLIKKINYKLYYYYKGLLFSFVLYFTFHFIVRFSDIYYKDLFNYFFDENNFIIKIFFFLLPFLFGLYIYFFSKINVSKIYKFLLILIIILISMSLIRFKDIYIIEKNNKNNYLKSNYQNLITNDKIKYPSDKKKVFLLLFDNFDNYYLKKNLNYLPNLKKLISSSYVNEKFFPTGKYTRSSIPGMLLGTSIKKIVIKNGELSIINIENQKIDLNTKNSIFGDLDKRNLRSSIFGEYHPYCRVLKVEICYDNLNRTKEIISFYKSIEIFMHITYISRIYNNQANISKDKNKYKEQHSQLGKYLHENSNKFINTDAEFIYVHYNYPHPPLITDQFVNLPDFNKELSDYEKNIFIVEKSIAQIINDLKKFEGSMLIITSDHWHRNRNDNKAHPMVFMAKIIGDDQSFTSYKSSNASGIKKLILNFFDQKILENHDIKLYFDRAINHKVFMK